MRAASLDSLANLVHHCESFARQMLATQGGFLPFATFVNDRDELEMIGVQATPRDNAQAVLESLQGAIARLASERRLIAFAVAANVDIPARFEPPCPDGIRIHVETPGYARDVYTPYRLLPHQRMRKFLAILPTVAYDKPIDVDVAPTLFK